MRLPTYAVARTSLLNHLACLGWQTKPKLKVPQACRDGHILYFHKQAVYLDAHSLFFDIRQLSRDEFDAMVADAIATRTQRTSENADY
jgi:hypothetical protein